METIETTFERYAAYKDSGVEWLGEIPEHWEVVAIKRVLAIPITDGPHTTPELIEEGIPFISAESIKNGKIDFSKKRGFISEKNHLLFSKKYNPQLWDIYMVKSGATTGNTAIVETNKTFSIWSPLAVFRANKQKVSPRYLNLFLQSSTFKISVELSWSFGTQQNIGMGILSNLPMSVPPLSEQTRIAEFLDRKTAQIDQAIAQKERLIELLKERRQVMIHQAVTCGLNPNVPLKDSGIEWIGEIPEHWEVKKLKYLSSKISKGTTPSTIGKEMVDEGIKFLKAENITENGISDEPKFYIDEDTNRILRRSALQVDDILFVIAGATIGKTAVLTKKHAPCNTNQAVCFIRPNYACHPHIISELLQSDYIKQIINMNSVVSAQPNISMEEVGNFPLPISINKTEQLMILNYINEMRSLYSNIMGNYKSQIQKLQELKATLINSAVTGKIKVS